MVNMNRQGHPSSTPTTPQHPTAPLNQNVDQLEQPRSSGLVTAADFAQGPPSTGTTPTIEARPPLPASNSRKSSTSPPSSSTTTTTKRERERQIKLPPPPESPLQGSTKATTTPPTPGSTRSDATGSTRGSRTTLDEFGLPRVSPPRGYFDGDNEGDGSSEGQNEGGSNRERD